MEGDRISVSVVEEKVEKGKALLLFKYMTKKQCKETNSPFL